MACLGLVWDLRPVPQRVLSSMRGRRDGRVRRRENGA
jgi:hypothetical protein